MEVSLYSEKRADEMSEVERLRVVTQLQQKIIGNQEEIIRNLKRQLAATEGIVEQFHKRLKENGLV